MSVRELKISEVKKTAELDLRSFCHVLIGHLHILGYAIEESLSCIENNKKVVTSQRDVRNATMNLDKLHKLYRKKSLSYSRDFVTKQRESKGE